MNSIYCSQGPSAGDSGRAMLHLETADGVFRTVWYSSSRKAIWWGCGFHQVEGLFFFFNLAHFYFSWEWDRGVPFFVTYWPTFISQGDVGPISCAPKYSKLSFILTRSPRSFLNVKPRTMTVSLYFRCARLLSALRCLINYNRNASQRLLCVWHFLSTLHGFHLFSQQPCLVGAVMFSCFSDETKTQRWSHLTKVTQWQVSKPSSQETEFVQLTLHMKEGGVQWLSEG